ncbi:MAG: ribonuclease III [Chloroflexota bacterium]|nr:ribonuclease III [Chloroflexota bacterium]
MTDFIELQEKLDIIFRDPMLLQQSLVHRSYLHENPDFSLPSNERLEFLGDSMLGIVIAEKLFRDYPNLSEGGMTKLRAALVRRETLARMSRYSLTLGDYLYLGHGEEASGGRSKQSILAGAFEAVIGAVLVDQGFEACRGLILRLYEGEVERAFEERLSGDFKSQLQEVVQARYHETPVYRIVREEGPDHAKEFTVEVIVGGGVIGVGCGRNKRSAEKEAARVALDTLGGEG